jgi:hypothetical protein
MKKIVFALILMLLAKGMTAQEIAMPDLQGYKKATNYPVYTPDNLWDFIDGAADTYLSYGFSNLHVAEYKKGKNLIKLEIYTHKDEVQTFGIYSTERSPSFTFINVGAQGYKTDGTLNFLKGKYYVKIRTYSKSQKVLQMVETLANKVSNMLTGSSDLPAVLKEFPDMGKKPNEETYIKQSVLGHEFLSGAFKAKYTSGNSDFIIFIFKKNSTEESFKTVASYLKSAGIEMEEQTEGKYIFKDGYNGDIFLSWKEDTIVIISGLSKDQTSLAGSYISEIIR